MFVAQKQKTDSLSGFSVTMQALKQAPPDMQCKDKFLVQSAVVAEGTTVKDISAEMVVCILISFVGWIMLGDLCFSSASK